MTWAVSRCLPQQTAARRSIIHGSLEFLIGTNGIYVKPSPRLCVCVTHVYLPFPAQERAVVKRAAIKLYVLTSFGFRFYDEIMETPRPVSAPIAHIWHMQLGRARNGLL